MKKCLFALVGLLSLFGFIACNMNDDGNENGTETKTIGKAENLQKKKERYKKDYLGTSWKIRDGQTNETGISTISFTENSVTLDNVEYSINQDTDLYLSDELNDYYCESTESKNIFGNFYEIYIKLVDDCYYCFEYNSVLDRITAGFYKQTNGTWIRKDNKYTRVSSSESGNSETTYTGSYSFNNSTGSQQNGTITLKDGNWSYSGDKSNPAVSSGTYSVNGSKVTLNWTAASNNVSETFTISTSDNSSTWTSEYSGTSLLFSMLFGVVNTEMTFTYSE